MPAATFSLAEAKAANFIIVDQKGKGEQSVHDLIVSYRANRRNGTACTKTRGEVRGSGKKIYRQKGTGNARHRDRRAPIFVGGGVAFGPRPRDFSKKVTKSVRKLALRKALGETIKAQNVFTIQSFSIPDSKTKSFIAAVKDLTDAGKVLIVSKSFDQSTKLAARNVQKTLLMTADELNVEHILHYDAIILVEDALEIIAARTA